MYLITQSLLSAWGYCFDCYEGCEEDARASFLQVLNREPTEPTEAMRKGRAFEDEVYKAADGIDREPHPVWEDGIQAVAGIVTGAVFQVKAKRTIIVDGMEFLVYGILDAMKAGTIYDVKFLSSNMGGTDLAGKYLKSPQHPAYLYICPECCEFKYLVSDGSSVYQERYTAENTPFIGDIISEFIQSITAMGLLDLYKEKWVAK